MQIKVMDSISFMYVYYVVSFTTFIFTYNANITYSFVGTVVRKTQ